jgi:hypothetical protein
LRKKLQTESARQRGLGIEGLSSFGEAPTMPRSQMVWQFDAKIVTF